MMRLFWLTICVALGLASAEPSERLPLPAPLRAEILPWFAARDGKNAGMPFSRTSLANLVKQSGAKRVALVYFASWCVPCRAGVLELRAQTAALDAQKIAVVLVHVGEEPDELVDKWVAQNGLAKWPLVRDPFGRLTEGFGLIQEGEQMALPRTILVNAALKPLLHIRAEGDDWPLLLWETQGEK